MELTVIIFSAIGLDLLLGDPRLSFHPVALMGKLALCLEKPFRYIIKNEFVAGMLCSLSVYAIFAIAAGLATWSAGTYRYLAAAFFLYTAIAPRSLSGHAMAVYRELRKGNIDAARKKVAMIVSRDAEALDECGIVRSCVESLGENFTDGVASAIFYAAIGYLIYGAVGCAAAVWFFRSANTLDATFGYKNKRYIRFGTFPARMDDILNYIPARLTPFAIAIASVFLGLRPLNALFCAFRDHGKHPSPNSAWGMASFAGALGVRLGGRTKYRDGWHDYPFWGNNIEELEKKHIKQSCHLVIAGTFVFAATVALVVFFYKWQLF
ncbi:MAG: adenosylcobinamide-phosphate synthase CbiB [Victivallales bacterium]